MRCSLAAITCSLVLAVGVGRAQAAAYSFQTIDPPGSRPFTQLNGINDLGQIVGVYFGPIMGSNGSTINGFEYKAGNFVSIPTAGDPSSNDNYLYGINNNGQIVGQHGAGSGFVDTNGNFVSVPLPAQAPSNSDYVFLPNSINDLGQIAGSDFESRHAAGPYGGRVLNTDGSATVVSLPIAGSNVITVTGINNGGQITGTYNVTAQGQTSFVGGFLDINGVVSTLVVPGAMGDTAPQGISNSGEVVGNVYTFSPTYVSHGFAYDNGVYTTIDVPGATSTFAEGVNVEGDIVGSYSDATGTHGFLATPVSVPEPASLSLLTAALAAFGLAIRRRSAA